MDWILPATIPIPTYLENAYRLSIRRTIIDRYRSRTTVTPDHISCAYSWLRLPVISNDELITSDITSTRMKYKTAPIPRGVPEEEALRNIQNILSNLLEINYPVSVVMLNTGTAAAGTARVKAWLDEHESWNEMNVAAMVTSTPSHKINMYKFQTESIRCYIILNNLDTPAVVFKIATAIMLDMNLFGNKTETLAAAWLNGKADDIYTAVANYYAEYNATIQQRNRERALENLSKAMVVDKSEEFKRKINTVQSEIDELFSEITTKTEHLNKIKGEYLLYKLEDQEDKGKELREFFESCGNKITYINYTNDMLYITYRTALIYYEAEILERYFDSNRTNCITAAPAYIQQLLIDTFLNKDYTFLIESGAAINISRNTIVFKNARELRACSNSELLGLPNPHHRHYNCWGDNASIISRALMEKNYITAILTAFAAMSGINMADMPVLEKFVREDLTCYTDIPCLEDNKTHEILTIEQYKRRYEDASDETDE